MTEMNETNTNAKEKYHRVLSEVSSINHEINNHLTTIIGNIDLILMTNPDLNSSVKNKLSTILEKARCIAEINKKLSALI